MWDYSSASGAEVPVWFVFARQVPASGKLQVS
jgi:hypothetical protein